MDDLSRILIAVGNLTTQVSRLTAASDKALRKIERRMMKGARLESRIIALEASPNAEDDPPPSSQESLVKAVTELTASLLQVLNLAKRVEKLEEYFPGTLMDELQQLRQEVTLLRKGRDRPDSPPHSQ